MTIEGQLNLCNKRIEISDAYEELDLHFCLANPVPIRSHDTPIHSPLIEAPRVVRVIVPLPSCARGAVEMPILHSDDPDCCWVVWCFRCQKVGHVVSQCPRKKRSCKCATCGGTHKVTRCPINTDTTSPEVVTSGAGKDTNGERMTLLECIALLDCIKYSPTHCTKCGCQNLEHMEMECVTKRRVDSYYTVMTHVSK